MMDKIVLLLKSSTGMFPMLLLKHYKEFHLSDSEFILLLELLNTDLEFNPKQISYDLKLEMTEVLEMMNGLVDKGILEIEVRKVRNLRSEYINLDKLVSTVFEEAIFEILTSDEQFTNLSVNKRVLKNNKNYYLR